MPADRQLAAIMFTDIVGYTALMGEDEQRAFDLLRKNRQLQKPLIEKFNGTWIKEIGDGILVSFHTVTDAGICAIEIQKACTHVNDLKLRIGIHLGEVVFEDNDVFGDAVNIASRLQALAPIGSIYISESVYKNIANKKGVASHFVCEETLKNVKEPVKVYEIDIDSFEEEQFKQSYGSHEPAEKGAQKKYITTPKEKATHAFITQTQGKKFITPQLFIWLSLIIILSVAGFLFIPRWMKIQEARNEWIPQIQKFADADFLPPTKAFDLAREAEKYIPKDSTLLKLWPKIAWNVTIESDPPGAELYWKDYDDPEGEWKRLGQTPLKNVWFPRGFARVKVEKKGFQTLYQPASLKLKLDSVGKIPENMVRVGGMKSNMLIVGLEQYSGPYINDFLIDKYEVTNKEFKRFVDADGYKNKTYWDYSFYSEKKEISWEQAMDLFRDKTGRSGPADWEVGNYPEGKDNYPVTGISWYEAMAYAKFVGKILPTVYHWSLIADTWNITEIISRSNFNGKGTVPVGSLNGINSWGVYDVAGNVREWCFNETDKKGWHYILGGGWNDPTYAYNDAFAQPALDRSLSNGFRCVKILASDSIFNKLSAPLKLAFRDYKTEKPVNDQTFNIFLRQFVYDTSPLNPNVTMIFDSSFCKIEKIDIDAAYNKERMTLYLFLPKNVAPPYQTIVFFPHSGTIDSRNFDFRAEISLIDFIVKSGRAACYPILKGTFKRGDGLRSDLQDETVFYKDHVIMWEQDISRCLDYLETLKNIIHDKYGYYGLSWGSSIAPVVLGTEKRFKTAVLNVGGLQMQKTFPEVDPFNFLPRVKIPVLMLNGKNDTFFPIETSQKPMFKLLGTDEKDKKMIVYEGGHLVPRSELIKESLSWYDKYLGTVK